MTAACSYHGLGRGRCALGEDPEWAGHASLLQTIDRYTNKMSGDDEAAVKEWQDALEPKAADRCCACQERLREAAASARRSTNGAIR
jgi:hypothetical protein